MGGVSIFFFFFAPPIRGCKYFLFFFTHPPIRGCKYFLFFFTHPPIRGGEYFFFLFFYLYKPSPNPAWECKEILFFLLLYTDPSTGVELLCGPLANANSHWYDLTCFESKRRIREARGLPDDFYPPITTINEFGSIRIIACLRARRNLALSRTQIVTGMI